MEQIQLGAQLRAGKGKQAAKKLRSTGQVPCVVYHRGEKSVSVSVSDKEMRKILLSAAGANALISLKIGEDKKKTRAVLIKEVQVHPVKRALLHIDFNEISLTEMITVDVEVVAIGESIGVKQEGGSLDHPLREVKIQCLPTDIPKSIEVDVTGLKLNDSVHVKDLKVSDKIKILTDPESLLFQVKLHEIKIEEPAAAETGPTEPEVLREKKEEEGAEKGEKGKEEEPPAKGGSASGGKTEKEKK